MVCIARLLSLRSSMRLAALAAAAGILSTAQVSAQTYSSCNPTKQSGCAADPALGRSINVDFTSGASNEFTAQGNVAYSSNGAAFTVASSGQAPTIVSNWYMMFGKYSVTMKASPGTGIVSSVVLQSDDLDEIDWEWLGGQGGAVQSNYFGKGQTTTYDRAASHAVSNTEGQWHTYTLEWTSTQVIWTIDGATVRVLNAADAKGQFPQSPMQLKIGSWSGGDPSNSPGTIEWAGGATNYAAGPFTMYVKSVSAVDYSTGKSYSYGDQSGAWTSIQSTGGKVNGNAGGAVVVGGSGSSGSSSSSNSGSSSGTSVVAPAITSTNSGPDTWDGTHKTNTATVSYTSYEGLPSGWVVTSSGKVVPPSAAPSTSLTAPTSTPSPSSSSLSSAGPACSGGGYDVVTGFNQQGFATTVTVPAGIRTAWDERGFPVTVYPAGCAATNPPAAIQQKMQLTTSAPSAASVTEFAPVTMNPPAPTTLQSSLVSAQGSSSVGYLAAPVAGSGAAGVRVGGAMGWACWAAGLSGVFVLGIFA